MTGVCPHSGSARARSWATALLLLLAAVPVAHIFVQIARACRNIAFWDEFDSVLALVLRLDAGLGWREFAAQLLQLDSEHRTVVSRLFIADLYGLTGSVNFDVICLAGNAALFALCAMLVAVAQPFERRVRLGVLLAFGLFHLEHYETFLWSGAAIDHFVVLLLAGATLFALTQSGWRATAGAALFALLANFTLAHGCLLWPLGAALLWTRGRSRELVAWIATGALALVVFFYGFEIDAAHRVRDFSAAGLSRLGQFWLALLGGPLTFGGRDGAPLYGGLLLAWLLAGGAWKREPVLLPLALFAVGSLALVAFGRLAVAGPQIQSRYLVLASLAWTLTAGMILERFTQPTRPFRLLAWSLPALVAFNFAANFCSAHDAHAFLWSREYAAVRFKQYGEEGHAGPFRLHPREGVAKSILRQTQARGIYQLPRFSNEATVPAPESNPSMITYVTDLTANERTVGFEGWAMVPHRKSKRGEIHVVLRSAKSFLVFSTFSVARPDVAKAFKEPDWEFCGYNFVLGRHRLPAEDFQIGLLLSDGDRAELKMTDQRLNLEAGQ